MLVYGGTPCASRSSWPRRASPRAAPPRRSSAPGRVTVDGATVADPARDVEPGDGSRSTARRSAPAADAGRLRGQQAGRGRLDRQRPPAPPDGRLAGRPRAAPVPGRAPGHRHHRPDPAHQRRRARPPAHPSALRGAQDLSRACLAGRRSRDAALSALRAGVELEDGRTAPARVRRTGRRHDRDHDPRGPQAPGQADVRARRASACAASSGCLRAAAAGRPGAGGHRRLTRPRCSAARGRARQPRVSVSRSRPVLRQTVSAQIATILSVCVGTRDRPKRHDHQPCCRTQSPSGGSRRAGPMRRSGADGCGRRQRGAPAALGLSRRCGSGSVARGRGRPWSRSSWARCWSWLRRRRSLGPRPPQRPDVPQLGGRTAARRSARG